MAPGPKNNSIRFAFVALVLLALVTLPYLLAVQAGGEQFVFAGFLLNVQDGQTYLAKMRQGWEGAWTFHLPYTAEPGEGSYLFLFYLFLGHLARWLGLPLLVVFHAARVLGAVGLLAALYRFLQRMVPQQALWLAFTLSVLGSGMGWLSLPFGGLPSDFWVAETYPFLSAFATPHFAWGLALLLGLLTLPEPSMQAGTIMGVRRMAFRQAVWTFLPALALSILSPFGVVIAGIVLGGLLIWNLVSGAARLSPILFGRLAGLGLGGGPILVYDLWISSVHPVLSGWNAQNLTPSPPLWDLMLSLSPAILLTPLALRVILSRPKDDPTWQSGRLLLVWLGLGLILLYLPWGLQRRFMMGLYVPAAALAGIALAEISRRRTRPLWGRLLPAMILLLSLPTNLLVISAVLHGARIHDPALFLTRDEAAALEWIEDNTPAGSLVLASPETGLFIPGWAGRRVLYGHPFETVPAEAKKAEVEAFFAGQAGPDWMIRRGVDYLFAGPREAALANDGEALVAGLPVEQVYAEGEVRIYTVRP